MARFVCLRFGNLLSHVYTWLGRSTLYSSSATATATATTTTTTTTIIHIQLYIWFSWMCVISRVPTFLFAFQRFRSIQYLRSNGMYIYIYISTSLQS